MRHTHKALLVVLALLLVLPLAGASAAPSTAGVPGGPFSTAFRVQNLGTDAANCSYAVYSDAGAASFTASLSPIAVNDSGYIFTPSVSGFPSGTFAGVVSCNQPVATVVNFSDPTKGDTYVGTTSPAPTLYIPSAYKNYFNYFTSFRIQNATATGQTVSVDYFAPGATTPTVHTTVALAGNGAATIDQSAVSGLLPNVSYSAKITGSSPLAATVSIFGNTGSSVANQLYAFSAFSGGATTIYAPVVMRNYYTNNTATTIQNIGSAAATVKLTYSNGTVKNYNIAQNSSQVVLDFNEPTLSANTLYSSKIESTNGQPLIVTVNESTPTTNRASTYEGMPSGGKTVVAPIVMKRYFKYNSAVTCQNIGAAATNIRVTYSGTAVSNKTVVTALAVGKAALIYQPAETGLANGYIGSATISADQNIVCEVNQDQNEGADAAVPNDQLFAYDAIVKP